MRFQTLCLSGLCAVLLFIGASRGQIQPVQSCGPNSPTLLSRVNPGLLLQARYRRYLITARDYFYRGIQTRIHQQQHMLQARAFQERAIQAQAFRARALQAQVLQARGFQFGNPYLSNPYARGRLTSVPVNPYSQALNGDIAPGGFNNPYGITIPNPYEGYARGVSGVIDAQGMYAIRYQQARLLNQQVEQARIATRKAIFDEWRHERMYTPTYQERLDKKREAQVIRARRNPPLTEILSGDSLNALLEHLQKKLAIGGKVPEIPVGQEVLDKINVTTGRGGNIALLRDEGKLTWPIGLRKEQFDRWRDAISNKAPEAVRQAESTNRVDADLYREMKENLKQLRTALGKCVSHLSLLDYTRSLKYLNLLDDAMTALQDPEVSNYFNHRFTAHGEDVAEVVKHMTKRGLKFTAATSTGIAAYRRFQELLTVLADAIDQPIAKR